MKKRIGIDARLYNQTGVGTYIKNLLHELDLIKHHDLDFYIYLLPEDIDKTNFKNPAIKKVASPYRWHSVSEQLGFLNILYRDKLNLMHFTYFSYPALYKGPFIATVHDLTPLFFKTGRASTRNPLVYEFKFRSFLYLLKKQIQNAKHIITPTQTVKNDIVDQFGTVYGDKITPFYEGVDFELLQAQENTLLKRQFPDPFVLYVGNFYPHKNVERLIEAYSQINTDIKLVLVGPKDFFAERIVAQINSLNKSQKILLYHSTSKSDLVFFYKNANALIHPSLSEGFGLPLVEAMHFGLPIVASDIPVFRELLGYHYTSFDPKDVEAIKNVIKNEITKPKKNINYVSVLSQFSFEKMAKRTASLYQVIV